MTGGMSSCPVDEQRRATLNRLIEAAILAPSGDNTQPWAFELQEDYGRIVVRVDAARDPSPMNAGQRMSRIAVGAAIENVVRTAALNKLALEVEWMDEQGAIAVRPSNVGDRTLQIDDAVRNRCTNRRLYDNQPIAAKVVDELNQASPGFEDIQTHWFTEPGRMVRLAALIRRSDALMFGASQLRRAFFANVRLDLPADSVASEGLSLDCLEVFGAERVAFRLLAKLPDWLATLLQVGHAIGKKSERLMRSASGICLVDAPDDESLTDIAVGRAMQHAWLALTEHGLSAQPMMSLAVLDSIVCFGTVELKRRLEDPVKAILQEFRELYPEIGQKRPGFLFRFGNCAPPNGRTGRRAVVIESLGSNAHKGRSNVCLE